MSGLAFACPRSSPNIHRFITRIKTTHVTVGSKCIRGYTAGIYWSVDVFVSVFFSRGFSLKIGHFRFEPRVFCTLKMYVCFIFFLFRFCVQCDQLLSHFYWCFTFKSPSLGVSRIVSSGPFRLSNVLRFLSWYADIYTLLGEAFLHSSCQVANFVCPKFYGLYPLTF